MQSQEKVPLVLGPISIIIKCWCLCHPHTITGKLCGWDVWPEMANYNYCFNQVCCICVGGHTRNIHHHIHHHLNLMHVTAHHVELIYASLVQSQEKVPLVLGPIIILICVSIDQTRHTSPHNLLLMGHEFDLFQLGNFGLSASIRYAVYVWVGTQEIWLTRIIWCMLQLLVWRRLMHVTMLVWLSYAC